jgi:hypothetical protein
VLDASFPSALLMVKPFKPPDAGAQIAFCTTNPGHGMVGRVYHHYDSETDQCGHQEPPSAARSGPLQCRLPFFLDFTVA